MVTETIHVLLQALCTPSRLCSHFTFIFNENVFICDRAWLPTELFEGQIVRLLRGMFDEEAYAFARLLINSSFGQAYFVKHSALMQEKRFIISERFATHQFEAFDYRYKYDCD